MGAIVITTTSDSLEHALVIAATLLDERLVACAQIGAIESMYHWKGSVDQASEWLITCKTRASFFGAVERRILELHHYETPQIVGFPIDPISQGYRDWILESTSSSAA